MRENNSWQHLIEKGNGRVQGATPLELSQSVADTQLLHVLPGIPSFSLVGMVASATNGCSALGDLEISSGDGKLLTIWSDLGRC